LRAVVKLGGALFRRDPDTSTIKHMANALTRFVDKNNQLLLVAGGGENARVYINAARKLGAEESTCDLLGIQITRANAELLRIAFPEETSVVIAGSATVAVCRSGASGPEPTPELAKARARPWPARRASRKSVLN